MSQFARLIYYQTATADVNIEQRSGSMIIPTLNIVNAKPVIIGANRITLNNFSLTQATS